MDDAIVIAEIAHKLTAAKVTICKTPYGFGLWPRQRVPKDVLPDVWDFEYDLWQLAKTKSDLKSATWTGRPPRHISYADIMFKGTSNVIPGEICPRCGNPIDGFCGDFGECEDCQLDDAFDD
jgi:hypothetical protein